METQELHRGRLIDHIQLVVRDLAASQAFYTAALGALKVPMGGADEGYFWRTSCLCRRPTALPREAT